MTPDQHIEHVRELAELKSQVADIANDVSTIVAKLEVIFGMQKQIVRMEQEQSEHRDSLKRAFERIEKSEGHNHATKENTDKWINRSIGGWVVGALLISVIQYLIIDRVRNYESTQIAHTESLVTLDRRTSWIEYEIKQHKNHKEVKE